MGRIDVVVEAEPVFRYEAAELGVSDQARYAGEAAPPEAVYIAFSPAIDNAGEYAQVLSEGMETLRASGELQRIMERYGLTDWRQPL